MLIYTLSSHRKIPLYEQLYRAIKIDIINGTLKTNDKLPPKRSLTKHLGISVVTVETSYQQLKAEDYIYSQAKKGFFVANIKPHRPPVKKTVRLVSAPVSIPDETKLTLDLSNNQANSETFLLVTWSGLVRQVFNNCQNELVTPSPSEGMPLLRQAIASHLNDYQGMTVDPRQVVIGTGTEYLYTLLIQLLGLDRAVALEESSYPKTTEIYRQFNINPIYIPMENDGLDTAQLKKSTADTVYLSSSHQFPTGAILSTSKRYKLLSWVGQGNHYIIEDDYDNEFRFQDLPIPDLQEIDSSGKVIYINTFSKSLASALRVSYMILPPQLLDTFEKKLNFYNNTVSNLEQHALTYFIQEGYFEKHLNHIRPSYQKGRDELIHRLMISSLNKRIGVHEQESGLHFILHIQSNLFKQTICQLTKKHELQMTPLLCYYRYQNTYSDKDFIVNYASITSVDIDKIINILL